MGAPITVYLELVEGRQADLETVACIAGNLSKLAKEAAFLAEPNAKVRLVLISGSDSSLGMNHGVEAENVDAAGQLRIYSVIWWVVSGLLTTVFIPYYSQMALDTLHGEDKVDLSDESLQNVISACTKAMDKQLKPFQQEIFRSIERDTAISGIGVSSGPGIKPDYILPRSRFSEFTGAKQQSAEKIRITDDTEDVVLLSPWLEEVERRWKVRSLRGEIGVYMQDWDFLHLAVNAQLKHPIKQGLRLKVRLKIKEVWDNGVWRPERYDILEVLDYHPGPEQTTLDMRSKPAL